jgi:hypothetical protein
MIPLPCPDHCFYLLAIPTYLIDGPDRDNAAIIGTYWDRAEAEEELAYRSEQMFDDYRPASHVFEIAVVTMI